MNRRVGADDKLAGRIFELDGQRARVEISFKLRVVGSGREPAIQRLKRMLGPVLEFLIVHEVASPPKPGPNFDSSEVGTFRPAWRICYPWNVAHDGVGLSSTH